MEQLDGWIEGCDGVMERFRRRMKRFYDRMDCFRRRLEHFCDRTKRSRDIMESLHGATAHPLARGLRAARGPRSWVEGRT
jgi:hypothetical protein